MYNLILIFYFYSLIKTAEAPSDDNLEASDNEHRSDCECLNCLMVKQKSDRRKTEKDWKQKSSNNLKITLN